MTTFEAREEAILPNQFTHAGETAGSNTVCGHQEVWARLWARGTLRSSVMLSSDVHRPVGKIDSTLMSLSTEKRHMRSKTEMRAIVGVTKAYYKYSSSGHISPLNGNATFFSLD